ncbi:MAG: NADH-quinone oxidoreductase subunit J [Akkermansiaceae bacterium]|nr:NADH-quinone oxidoreductase subunit J [Akkermansiaceae bacterium]
MIVPLLLSILMILAASAAVWLAKPVHAGLSLALTLAIAAVIYLVLGAHFIGLVQLMVYVGAVAVLIVFSLLITRRRDEEEERSLRPKALVMGFGCVLPLLAVLAYAVTGGIDIKPDRWEPALPLQELGKALFTDYAPAVLAIGVLLTAVMIGAALFARETRKETK